MQWAQNLCRICGQIKETCHSIFNDNVSNALEDKIKKCLNINLCKGDYKPKQVCETCLSKLNEFSEFMDTYHVTNQRFESIYFNSQYWQNKSYDYHPLTQKQSVIVSNKQIPDNLDIELYKNDIVLENLNITSDVLELVGDTNYNAEHCSDYGNIKERGPYTVLRHPNEDGYVQTFPCQDVTPQNNNRICYVNNSLNPNNSLVIEEDIAEKSTKKTITVNAVQNSLQKPVQPPHMKQKPKKEHLCPHCEKVFSRRGSLNSHVANHTNIRPYKCEDCSKTFPVKSELTTHKKIHGDEHKCLYCFKKFSVPSKLQRHLRIHTNDKPFVCNFSNCGRAFSDKRNLEGHKLIHTPDKKFCCPVCMKLFKTGNRLKQHSKCHTCNLMYTCDLCSKKYKYKSNLISHIKKHNNICPYCKLNCESNTVLTDHLGVCRARL